MRFTSKQKVNKYQNIKTTVDGIRFDSKAEAEYYLELKINGVKIEEMQPKVYLSKAKILYKPDFVIIEDGKRVWIDVKGAATPVFNLKARLWKAYGPGDLRIVKRVKNAFIIDKTINPFRSK